MANKATQEAGLTFNVNTIKGNLKQYYETHGLTVPQFTGGQQAMTAFLEKMYETILRECLKHIPKDKSGVRKVTLDSLQHAVLSHVGLEQYYLVSLKHFDPI